jgi:hypothetical protein
MVTGKARGHNQVATSGLLAHHHLWRNRKSDKALRHFLSKVPPNPFL